MRGREDNFLAQEGNSKTYLMLKMLYGEGITRPNENYEKKMFASKEDLGQLTGRAYGGYMGIKDVYDGNRYFYTMGYLEYAQPGSTTNKIAIVGPIAVTYNGTNAPVKNSEVYTIE